MHSNHFKEKIAQAIYQQLMFAGEALFTATENAAIELNAEVEFS
jgi:hypothetical protein